MHLGRQPQLRRAQLLRTAGQGSRSAVASFRFSPTLVSRLSAFGGPADAATRRLHRSTGVARGATHKEADESVFEGSASRRVESHAREDGPRGSLDRVDDNDPIAAVDEVLFERLLSAVFGGAAPDPELLQVLVAICRSQEQYATAMAAFRAARHSSAGFTVAVYEAQLLLHLTGRFGSLSDAIDVLSAAVHCRGDVVGAAVTAARGLLLRQCRSVRDVGAVRGVLTMIMEGRMASDVDLRHVAGLETRPVANDGSRSGAGASGAGAATAAGRRMAPKTDEAFDAASPAQLQGAVADCINSGRDDLAAAVLEAAAQRFGWRALSSQLLPWLSSTWMQPAGAAFSDFLRQPPPWGRSLMARILPLFDAQQSADAVRAGRHALVSPDGLRLPVLRTIAFAVLHSTAAPSAPAAPGGTAVNLASSGAQALPAEVEDVRSAASAAGAVRSAIRTMIAGAAGSATKASRNPLRLLSGSGGAEGVRGAGSDAVSSAMATFWRQTESSLLAECASLAACEGRTSLALHLCKMASAAAAESPPMAITSLLPPALPSPLPAPAPGPAPAARYSPPTFAQRLGFGRRTVDTPSASPGSASTPIASESSATGPASLSAPPAQPEAVLVASRLREVGGGRRLRAAVMTVMAQRGKQSSASAPASAPTAASESASTASAATAARSTGGGDLLSEALAVAQLDRLRGPPRFAKHSTTGSFTAAAAVPRAHVCDIDASTGLALLTAAAADVSTAIGLSVTALSSAPSADHASVPAWRALQHLGDAVTFVRAHRRRGWLSDAEVAVLLSAGHAVASAFPHTLADAARLMHAAIAGASPAIALPSGEDGIGALLSRAGGEALASDGAGGAQVASDGGNAGAAGAAYEAPSGRTQLLASARPGAVSSEGHGRGLSAVTSQSASHSAGASAAATASTAVVRTRVVDAAVAGNDVASIAAAPSGILQNAAAGSEAAAAAATLTASGVPLQGPRGDSSWAGDMQPLAAPQGDGSPAIVVSLLHHVAAASELSAAAGATTTDASEAAAPASTPSHGTLAELQASARFPLLFPDPAAHAAWAHLDSPLALPPPAPKSVLRVRTADEEAQSLRPTLYDKVELFDPAVMDSGVDAELVLDARTRLRMRGAWSVGRQGIEPPHPLLDAANNTLAAAEDAGVALAVRRLYSSASAASDPVSVAAAAAVLPGATFLPAANTAVAQLCAAVTRVLREGPPSRQDAAALADLASRAGASTGTTAAAGTAAGHFSAAGAAQFLLAVALQGCTRATVGPTLTKAPSTPPASKPGGSGAGSSSGGSSGSGGEGNERSSGGGWGSRRGGASGGKNRGSRASDGLGNAAGATSLSLWPQLPESWTTALRADGDAVQHSAAIIFESIWALAQGQQRDMAAGLASSPAASDASARARSSQSAGAHLLPPPARAAELMIEVLMRADIATVESGTAVASGAAATAANTENAAGSDASVSGVGAALGDSDAVDPSWAEACVSGASRGGVAALFPLPGNRYPGKFGLGARAASSAQAAAAVDLALLVLGEQNQPRQTLALAGADAVRTAASLLSPAMLVRLCMAASAHGLRALAAFQARGETAAVASAVGSAAAAGAVGGDDRWSAGIDGIRPVAGSVAPLGAASAGLVMGCSEVMPWVVRATALAAHWLQAPASVTCIPVDEALPFADAAQAAAVDPVEASESETSAEAVGVGGHDRKPSLSPLHAAAMASLEAEGRNVSRGLALTAHAAPGVAATRQWMSLPLVPAASLPAVAPGADKAATTDGTASDPLDVVPSASTTAAATATTESSSGVALLAAHSSAPAVASPAAALLRPSPRRIFSPDATASFAVFKSLTRLLLAAGQANAAAALYWRWCAIFCAGAPLASPRFASLACELVSSLSARGMFADALLVREHVRPFFVLPSEAEAAGQVATEATGDRSAGSRPRSAGRSGRHGKAGPASASSAVRFFAALPPHDRQRLRLSWINATCSLAEAGAVLATQQRALAAQLSQRIVQACLAVAGSLDGVQDRPSQRSAWSPDEAEPARSRTAAPAPVLVSLGLNLERRMPSPSATDHARSQADGSAAAAAALPNVQRYRVVQLLKEVGLITSSAAAAVDSTVASWARGDAAAAAAPSAAAAAAAPSAAAASEPQTHVLVPSVDIALCAYSVQCDADAPQPTSSDPMAAGLTALMRPCQAASAQCVMPQLTLAAPLGYQPFQHVPVPLLPAEMQLQAPLLGAMLWRPSALCASSPLFETAEAPGELHCRPSRALAVEFRNSVTGRALLAALLRNAGPGPCHAGAPAAPDAAVLDSSAAAAATPSWLPGLQAAVEWALQARAVLLATSSAIVSDVQSIVRESSEAEGRLNSSQLAAIATAKRGWLDIPGKSSASAGALSLLDSASAAAAASAASAEHSTTSALLKGGLVIGQPRFARALVLLAAAGGSPADAIRAFLACPAPQVGKNANANASAESIFEGDPVRAPPAFMMSQVAANALIRTLCDAVPALSHGESLSHWAKWSATVQSANARAAALAARLQRLADEAASSSSAAAASTTHVGAHTLEIEADVEAARLKARLHAVQRVASTLSSLKGILGTPAAPATANATAPAKGASHNASTLPPPRPPFVQKALSSLSALKLDARYRARCSAFADDLGIAPSAAVQLPSSAVKYLRLAADFLDATAVAGDFPGSNASGIHAIDVEGQRARVLLDSAMVLYQLLQGRALTDLHYAPSGAASPAMVQPSTTQALLLAMSRRTHAAGMSDVFAHLRAVGELPLLPSGDAMEVEQLVSDVETAASITRDPDEHDDRDEHGAERGATVPHEDLGSTRSAAGDRLQAQHSWDELDVSEALAELIAEGSDAHRHHGAADAAGSSTALSPSSFSPPVPRQAAKASKPRSPFSRKGSSSAVPASAAAAAAAVAASASRSLDARAGHGPLV